MSKPAIGSLTEGQRAYEAKRAAKAGVSLEKWLTLKAREADKEAKKVVVAKPVKPPGMLKRLIDRAHKPI